MTRHWTAQAAAALILPAMTVLALLGVIRLVGDIASYQHEITGTATQAVSCISDDEMFNRCAPLDPSQIIDLRTDHADTELDVR